MNRPLSGCPSPDAQAEICHSATSGVGPDYIHPSIGSSIFTLLAVLGEDSPWFERIEGEKWDQYGTEGGRARENDELRNQSLSIPRSICEDLNRNGQFQAD